MSKKTQTALPAWRRYCLALIVVSVMSVLAWRAVDLHIFEHEFLQAQADARHLRSVSLSAHRGMISDRRGRPLAVSTPVDSIVANPKQLLASVNDTSTLAKALGVKTSHLNRLLKKNAEREFLYLQRHVAPADARARAATTQLSWRFLAARAAC